MRKIPIGDDSKLARMGLTRAVSPSRPGWEIVEASDAADALDVIRRGDIDVALVDFNMRGSDGLTLIATIREVYRVMPIAMVLANIQEQIIRRSRELDAAFVPKPVTDEDLGSFLSGAMLRLNKVDQ
jgi:CheY-like chemotaxis protein